VLVDIIHIIFICTIVGIIFYVQFGSFSENTQVSLTFGVVGVIGSF